MSTRSVSSSSYRRMFGGPGTASRPSSTRSYVTTSTRTYSLGSVGKIKQANQAGVTMGGVPVISLIILLPS